MTRVNEKQIEFTKVVTAPTSTDDISKGYQIGSSVVDTITAKRYWCSDNTLNNAVWQEYGASSGGNTFDTLQFKDTAGNITLKDLPAIEYTVGSANSYSAGKCQYSSLQTAIAALPPFGRVSAIQLAAAGTGYIATETVTLDGGDDNYYIIIDTVGGSGEILTWHATGVNISTGYNIGINSVTSLGSGTGASFYTSIYFPIVKCHSDYNDITDDLTISRASNIYAEYLMCSAENKTITLNGSLNCKTVLAQNLTLSINQANDLNIDFLFKIPYLTSGANVAIIKTTSSGDSNCTITGKHYFATNDYNLIDCENGTLIVNNALLEVSDGSAIRINGKTYTNANTIILYNCTIKQNGTSGMIYAVNSGDSNCTTLIYGGKILSYGSGTRFAFYMGGGIIRAYGVDISGFTSLCNGTGGELTIIGAKFDSMVVSEPVGVSLHVLKADKVIGDFDVTENITCGNNITATTDLTAGQDVKYHGFINAPLYTGAISNEQVISSQMSRINGNMAGLMYIWVKASIGGGGTQHNMVAYVRFDGGSNPATQPTVKLLTDTDTATGFGTFFTTTKDNAGTLNIYFDTDGYFKIQSKLGFTNTILDSAIIPTFMFHDSV